MIISVIGAGACDAEISAIAEEIGRGIAQHGAMLVTGGLGGVMEAASRGAYEAGGVTIGILPGFSKDDANQYITVPVVTGLSHARNVIVVRTGDAVIAISGEYGTLSEIAIALKLGKPVVGIRTWKDLKGVVYVDSAEEAVSKIIEVTGTGK